jgi:hypothetical protein
MDAVAPQIFGSLVEARAAAEAGDRRLEDALGEAQKAQPSPAIPGSAVSATGSLRGVTETIQEWLGKGPWNPDLHPKGEGGRFVVNDGGGRSKSDTKEERPFDDLPSALQKEITDTAQAARAVAQAIEPETTARLESIAAGAGARLQGTEFAVKGQESLEDKIVKVIDEARAGGETVTPQAAMDRIFDVHRYTMVSSPEDYARNTESTVRQMEAQGYDFQPGRFRNTWAEGNPYRGLNTTVRDPQGRTFELQFHTQESFDTKMEQHPIYEKIRDPGTPPEEQSTLLKQMAARSSQIFEPPGVAALTADNLGL